VPNTRMNHVSNRALAQEDKFPNRGTTKKIDSPRQLKYILKKCVHKKIAYFG